MTSWEEAIEQAKDELCVHGYVDKYKWSEVVEEAKSILQEEREEGHDRLSEEGRAQHQQYLQSEEWKAKRDYVMQRDNYHCRICKKVATEVHHLNYCFIGDKHEVDFCISVCHKCHEDQYERTMRLNHLLNRTYETVILTTEKEFRNSEDPWKIEE
jgi:5-methylcytosine-specific restriction endonuclease McrA